MWNKLLRNTKRGYRGILAGANAHNARGVSLGDQRLELCTKAFGFLKMCT